ncbi:hypothetical protein BTUL_0177g00170 [Botrytis tulipae]|uniref:Uncharacterized protein n=1 Tax=Botrytis tulipae TaxID=87230 RepID=A0A4Z1EFE7_9HELO|nr:hypothetical protein BTUL_0177g00170 [Botrytis tulipae]
MESTASMGPSSRVGNVSPSKDARNKKARRTQSAPITTRKSPTTTAMHRKEGNYQHLEYRGIKGAAMAGGRRNTSFLALVRGLVFRR